MTSRKSSIKNKDISVSDGQTFHLIFDGHSAVMLLVDPQAGDILDANQAAVDFYGYPKPKLCSMKIGEINTLPPEQVAAESQKALKEERNYFVFSHRLASGEERIVEVHSSPITLQEKQVLFSIIHDITERKKAEVDLHESEEKFRSIIEFSSDGVILTDENGFIVEWNPAQAQIVGLARADVIGVPLWDIQFQNLLVERRTPEIYQRIKGYFQYMLASGEIPEQAREQQATIQNTSGIVRVIRSAVFIIKTAHGFRLAGISRDITERKKTEDLLEKTHKNYETFFNSIDDFLFVLDDKGNILHTNKTVTDRLGYSKEELSEKSVLMVHPPERREEAGRIVGEMLAGSAEFCPVPLMTKSGERIPVETRVAPGVWDGKPAIFGVTKDMSQIKLSEEKFSKIFQSNSVLMALSYLESGVFIDVNDVFLKTLGFSRDEVIGTTSKDIHLFADADQRNKIIEEMKQNGAVKEVKVLVRTKDGSLRYGLFSADTIYIGKDECLLTVMVDITERERAEEALRESQLLYHSLVEGSPLSICRKDLAGRFTFANQRFLELSQITLADLVGKTDFDLHPSELAEKYRRDDQAVLDSKQVQELIEERVVLGGESVIVQSIKTPIYDGSGKINGIQISFWDITDRKRATDALRESEISLNRAQSIAHVGSWNLDVRRNSAVWSAETYRIFECPSETPLNYEAFLTHVYPDDVDFLNRSWQAALQGAPYDIEHRILAANGKVKWVRERAELETDAEGNALRAIGTVQDITERKQMEEAVRESERFARSTVDALSAEVVILDETGSIIAANRAWVELAEAELSVPATVCVGANYLTVCDTTRGPDAVYARAIASGIRAIIRGKLTEFSFEYPCEFFAGSCLEKRWFNAKVTRFAGDYPIRVVVAHENVTARKQAEERLQQQNVYLSVLHQITLDLLNHRNMDDLLQTIVNRAVVLLDAPFGELMLEKNDELVVQTFTDNLESLKGSRVGRDDAKLSWLAFDTKKTAVLDDYSTYPYRRNIYAGDNLQAVADFPILVRDKCIGILALGRSQAGYVFSEIQIKNGELFAQLVALVLDNAQLFSAAEHEISERRWAEAELRRAKDALLIAHRDLEQSYLIEKQLARTDTLTGVNNRGYLFELAAREFNVALRYQLSFSIIMFDIDYFKHVNDTFGHLMGDQVLQGVTQAVCAEIRSADLIGRYGGDEFIVLMPQTTAQEALPLAERIHASVAALRIATDKDPLTVTISIGIAQAVYNAVPESGLADTVEGLFLRADKALYKAKQAGRNCTVIFD